MILVLQSTTFGAHGGIPTYNRVVCRALDEFDGSIEKRVLVATDKPEDLESYHAEFSHIQVQAFSGRRLAFAWKAIRLALTRKIDLVVIGHVNYAPLGRLLRLLQPSMHYSVMMHGVDVWSTLSHTRRWALKGADFITSVSEFTTRTAVSVNGIDREQVYLLPNALEWNEDDAGESTPPGLSSKGTQLLTVCRFSQTERYKGVDIVIQALPAVLKAVPELTYYVIGSGEDLDRHKELARRLGVADHVHFLGSVDTPTLRSYYKSCDIFVMPSAGEGFGIVFLEAMRYSKPVVAANSGAVSEVVVDEVTGRLVEYGNESELAQTLVELCLDPQKRTELGAAGYQRLQENFTFAHFKQKLTEILSSELTSTMDLNPKLDQRTPQIP